MHDHSTPSTRSGKSSRPSKPYPEFPLFPHAAGVWAKKIRGKLHYFGPWSDPDGALAEYLKKKDALHAGRTPKLDTDAVLVKDVCNEFLIAKQALVNTGELSPRTFADYKRACDLMVSRFGKGRLAADLAPEDFAELRKAMAKKWGPHRLATTIQYTRCAFKFAYESGRLDRPMRFGPGFKRPSKKTLRIHRAKQGVKLYAPEEIRRLIDKAGVPMKAMLLLAINCGYGNSDCGNLPLSSTDLEAGWIHYPRPKTGIDRRCPLWPETVAALREAIAKRPKPKSAADAELVFITKYGDGWAKDTSDAPISKEMRKLLNAAGIEHGSYYTLRHTFRTVADEARDQPAADHIMGHEVAHMSSVYREGIGDERLKAVAEHVRGWLFGAGPDTGKANEPPAEQLDPSNLLEQGKGDERPALKLFAG